MIIVQIVLGGITRLTESGLSITEWQPVKGVLPPLSEAAWQTAFEKYQQTDQFKYLHQKFTLSDYKFIFFWEWLHRLWARLMGLVFLAGFVYFLATKKFTRNMVLPMVVLFILGALQGAIGWLMVKSGLVPEKYFVGHVELTTHLVAAIILLVYVYWFALNLRPSFAQTVSSKSLRQWCRLLVVLFMLQMIYGGFMAGLHAGKSAPTWPSINGYAAPPQLGEMQPALLNLTHNPITIQFIHRGLAYLILALSLVFLWRTTRRQLPAIFTRYRNGYAALVVLQVVLGIFTVVNATNPLRLLWLGVAHQLNAMLCLLALVTLLFLLRRGQPQTAPPASTHA